MLIKSLISGVIKFSIGFDTSERRIRVLPPITVSVFVGVVKTNIICSIPISYFPHDG